MNKHSPPGSSPATLPWACSWAGLAVARAGPSPSPVPSQTLPQWGSGTSSAHGTSWLVDGKMRKSTFPSSCELFPGATGPWSAPSAPLHTSSPIPTQAGQKHQLRGVWEAPPSSQPPQGLPWAWGVSWSPWPFPPPNSSNPDTLPAARGVGWGDTRDTPQKLLLKSKACGHSRWFNLETLQVAQSLPKNLRAAGPHPSPHPVPPPCRIP